MFNKNNRIHVKKPNSTIGQVSFIFYISNFYLLFLQPFFSYLEANKDLESPHLEHWLILYGIYDKKRV